MVPCVPFFFTRAVVAFIMHVNGRRMKWTGGTCRSTVERVHWAHSIVPCLRNRKGLVVVLDEGWGQ